MAVQVQRFTTLGKRDRTHARSEFQNVLLVGGRSPGAARYAGGTPDAGLRAIYRECRRPWIGWPDVALGPAEAERAHRFATAVLGPLLRGTDPWKRLDSADWDAYRSVNARFAEAVLRSLGTRDRVWIHDHHLMLLPRMLRRLRPDVAVGFFLHTPFPAAERFARLPMAEELLDGLLGADAIGLQARAHADHLGTAIESLAARATSLASGSGLADDHGRPVCLHTSPMTVDAGAFAARAAEPAIARRVAGLRSAGSPLLLGVGGLDEADGALERLTGFSLLLDRRPDLRGSARLVEVVLPDRRPPTRTALRTRVEGLVAAINGRLGTPSWRPVEYLYGRMGDDALVALYRAADVMLATPLDEGASLAAKEFVASRTDEAGVLVLGASPDAATELPAALTVDPADAEALARACGDALGMSAAERRVRMRRLLTRVRSYDLHRWSADCLHRLDEALHLSRPTACGAR